ncbi:hypothetical protein [uncultured Roseobacter sp.]|uniref:hypothetical protein n=1 Tax=uncultured Roseobacter sp. TaxID=114847 RepID=UPI00262F5F20|nr:hypothetical protein [uncultured Roseobacter sp.]
MGVLGEEYFQVPTRARKGAALVSEQETMLAEYENIEKKAKLKAAGQGALSPLEHWREAVAEVTAMKDAIVGGLFAMHWLEVTGPTGVVSSTPAF